MLLEIVHQTALLYSAPVYESHVELRLTPLSDSSQRLLQHRQRVVPQRPLSQYVNFLGNTVSTFSVLPAHDRIEITFESVVETLQVRFRGHGLVDPAHPAPAETLGLFDFLCETPLTRSSDMFVDWMQQHDWLRGAPPLEAAENIRKSIHSSFRYEGDVTTSSSTIDDLLKHGAGVCQDFTHLMMAACRRLGLPARYVSGYVLPAGDGPQQVESHAWCEVFDPVSGWFGMDPTHNDWADERHVRLGVGRDFRDVCPNRGVYRGQAEEVLQVSVLISPMKSTELSPIARPFLPQQRTQPGRARQTRKAPPVTILQQTLQTHYQQQQPQQQ